MSGPIDDALAIAQAKKESGNSFLKEALQVPAGEGQETLFRKALKEYHDGYLHLRSVDVSESKKEGFDDLLTGFLEEKQKKTDEQKSQLKALKVAIWNNMALIYHKQKKFERVEGAVENILGFEPKNEKALLKGVHSGFETNNLDRVEARLKALDQLGTVNEEEMKRWKHRLEVEIGKSSQGLKDKLKNMF